MRAAARELGIDKDDAHRALKVASLSDEAKEMARKKNPAGGRGSWFIYPLRGHLPSGQLKA